MTAKNSPPDFDLAQLQAFIPEEFKFDSELSRFILTLSLIFNDLKDLTWFYTQLSKYQPKPGINRIAGQFSGMQGHILRFEISLLCEVLRFFQKNSHILKDKELVACTEKMPKKAKKAWNDLISLVTKTHKIDGKETRFIDLLEFIRSNGTYHYYNTKALMKAYSENLSSKATLPNSRRAFVSFGKNMEGTRFYFADAAVQGIFYKTSDKIGRTEFETLIAAAMKNINESFRYVVARYINRNFSDSLRPYEEI